MDLGFADATAVVVGGGRTKAVLDKAAEDLSALGLTSISGTGVQAQLLHDGRQHQRRRR
jgi:hypothetical protein